MSSTIKFFFLGIIALTKNDLFASDIHNTDQEKFSQNKENELITLLTKYTEIGKNFKEEEKKEEYETYKNKYLETSKNNNNKEYYKLHNKTSEENEDVQTNNDIKKEKNQTNKEIKNENLQTNNEIKNENKQEIPHDYDYFCENEKIIEKDVARSLYYVPDSKRNEMRNKLRNVLNSLYFYKEKIEYLQGFHDIVGRMLICCEEEYVAFWFFIALYKRGFKEIWESYKKEGVGDITFHIAVLREYLFKTQKIPQRFLLAEYYDSIWLNICFSTMKTLHLHLDGDPSKKVLLYIFEKIFAEGFYFIYKIFLAKIQKTFSENPKDETEFFMTFQKYDSDAKFLEETINEAQNIELEKEDKEKFDSFYKKFYQRYQEKQELFDKIGVSETIPNEKKGELVSQIKSLILEDPNDLEKYKKYLYKFFPEKRSFLQRVSSFCTHLC